MARKYFNVNYEFDKETVHDRISEKINRHEADYICVADGVVLDNANHNPEYREVVNGGMFCICDSSYVPLYIKLLYGEKKGQYSGSDIFRDIVTSGKWRMAFLGSSQEILDALRGQLCKINAEVADMMFMDLPFKAVEEFDYPSIAESINRDGADIIWIALGAPKQEIFMHNLRPHINKGVMIAVGAVFKFFSGLEVSRAPQWMVRNHLEFIHRIYKEPSKQLRRCSRIVYHLPRMLWTEWRNKNN